MTRQNMTERTQALPDWAHEIELAAGKVGLRCSGMDGAFLSAMGVKVVTPVQDTQAAGAILWSLNRRPIMASQTSDQAIALCAKVLQPSIQIGLGTEMTDGQMVSMMQIAMGVAFMVSPGTMTIRRTCDDIEAIYLVAASRAQDPGYILAALKHLMAVQNVFGQWLNRELEDPIVDLIAYNYVLSIDDKARLEISHQKR